jgi:glycosyltransferase involved in cell wall biosynthesis
MKRREPPARKPARTAPVRVGFFGQINKFKGVDVLLRAVSLLPADARIRIEIGIHGANLDQQEEPFKAEITSLLQSNGDVVTLCGPYDNERVIELMSAYDWIVVPSIWWENSPVVIQEAHLAGKPVLCARMGGMAEKVTEDVNGRFFEPANASDLARQLARLAHDGGMPMIDAKAHLAVHAHAVDRHVEIYRRVANA